MRFSAKFLFQAISSLTSSAVSSVVAGAGLFLLIYSLSALRTASKLCDSEKEHLSSLPYSAYPNPIYEVKGCVLDSVSLTVSTSRLNLLSCEICLPLHNLAFSAVPSPVGLNVWRQTEENDWKRPVSRLHSMGDALCKVEKGNQEGMWVVHSYTSKKKSHSQ